MSKRMKTKKSLYIVTQHSALPDHTTYDNLQYAEEAAEMSAKRDRGMVTTVCKVVATFEHKTMRKVRYE